MKSKSSTQKEVCICPEVRGGYYVIPECPIHGINYKPMKSKEVVPLKEHLLEFIDECGSFTIHTGPLAGQVTAEQDDKLANEVLKLVAETIERVIPDKQETCDCDIHTKECDLMPFGYNQCVDDIKTRVKELGL